MFNGDDLFLTQSGFPEEPIWILFIHSNSHVSWLYFMQFFVLQKQHFAICCMHEALRPGLPGKTAFDYVHYAL